MTHGTSWAGILVTVAALVACERSSPTPMTPTSPAGPAQAAWFLDVTTAAGIEFVIDRAARGDYRMPESMNAGCGLFDYDGDGDLDLYLVNGYQDAEGRRRTRDGANRLYRQDPGGRFIDVTEAAGVGDEGYGMGVAIGDYDNDGDPDVYVTNWGRDTLYRNDGDGSFTDVSLEAGLVHDAWSASAGFIDFDVDGWLDLFVTHYLDYDPAVTATDGAGRPEYTSPGVFDGVPDVLLRNRGDGTFEDISRAAGIGDSPGKGLAVVFLDLDGDRRLDIYVANDGEPNFAWINDGAGHFAEQAFELGLATNAHGRAEASMGVGIGDANGDGQVDLYVTHLVQQTNTLYRRGPDGGYVDATRESGLGIATLDDTGFGVAFADIELDGDLDLLVANGRVLRRPPVHPSNLNPHWAPYGEPNRLFLNDGTGRFELAMDACGPLCGDVAVTRGLATGDLDDDGDVDVVVVNGEGTVRLYRNDAPRQGGFVTVRVVEPARGGRDALGAVVTAISGERRWIRDVGPARSYLSSVDPRVHFGLGDVAAVDLFVVRWPDGVDEQFDGAAANSRVTLRRHEGRRVEEMP